MESVSEHEEPQVLPPWLAVLYRFATALVLLMLIAAAISLVASAVLGIDSLWSWGLHAVAQLGDLLACT